MTQWPSLAAFSMATSATASWPWPKDTLWSFPRSIVKPSFLPGNRCRPPPPCETSYYDAFFSEILVLSSQIIFMDFLLSGSFVSSWMLLEHSHSIVVTLLVIYCTSAFLKPHQGRCEGVWVCICVTAWSLCMIVPSDSTSLSGSTPGERMKNTGEAGPLSR